MVQRRTSTGRLPDLPREIAASRLLAESGIGVYEGLVAGSTLQGLIDESTRSYATAGDQGSSAPNPEEDRGGVPLRRFLTGRGGPVQQAFYHSAWVREFLESVTGLRLKPTGSAGTFSYYVRPGDFLGLHRDILTCDIAVISMLYQEGAASRQSGALCVYPDRHREPLHEPFEVGDNGSHLRLLKHRFADEDVIRVRQFAGRGAWRDAPRQVAPLAAIPVDESTCEG